MVIRDKAIKNDVSKWKNQNVIFQSQPTTISISALLIFSKDERGHIVYSSLFFLPFMP